MFDVYLKQIVNGRPETSRINALPVCLEDANRWSNRLMQLKHDGVAGFENIQAVYVERSDEELRTGFLLSMMGAIHEVVSSQRDARRRAAFEASLEERDGEVEVIIYHSPAPKAPPTPAESPLRSSEREAARHCVAAV